MIIELQHFGPIRRFELDLTKDLTLVFGDNNIGKSYAIIAVYLICKNLSYFPERGRDNFRELMETIDSESIIFSEIRKKIKKAIDRLSTSTEVSVVDIVEDFAPASLTGFLDRLNDSFASSFSSIESLTPANSTHKPTIRFQTNQAEMELVSDSNKFIFQSVKCRREIKLQKVKQDKEVRFAETDTVIYFYYNEEVNLDENIERILNWVRNSPLYVVMPIMFPWAISYFLPASRSGLQQSLDTFAPILAEIARSRPYLSGKLNIPHIPEQIVDYLQELSTLRPTKESNELDRLVEELEKNVLKGSVEFDTKTKTLFYHGENLNHRLELAYTSSMVSELSPLVAFLKYILKRRKPKPGTQRLTYGLLFVEEPEVHLHPRAQVDLMELFARISQAGVQLILTSHSNYLFNKLNNLLLAGAIDPETVNSIYMQATPEGSISTDTMKAEADGMNDTNFADVAEELYYERMELYNKRNETGN
jgi:predicted ATPase